VRVVARGGALVFEGFVVVAISRRLSLKGFLSWALPAWASLHQVSHVKLYEFSPRPLQRIEHHAAHS